eukprot:CAMPEP_0116568584 /NCGR_PEP_ID=MMETSP0397-20121206/15741_1 /TAXON_ID=216820 /ORGANISM="Cyclophora tenuis, Strain ECT3854" /LENGTH=464 /DNA_ID=CAMNT_0004095897 /DNA_START=42 /DNA_END=1434 /DNA_ORIENTATION=+
MQCTPFFQMDIVGGEFDISESVPRSHGYTGEYAVGETVLTTEPIALVTREDDPSWSDFVNWVMLSLMYSENKGITQATVHTTNLLNTDGEVFGPEYASMFKKAVSVVGNYGEMYSRHLESLWPRHALNEINKGETALIMSLPFGNTRTVGESPPEDSTLTLIRRRGKLRCGVRPQFGFAHFNSTTGQWDGIEVDYCRAIAAAIFNGDYTKVDLIEVWSSDRFHALKNSEVDVLCRTSTATMQRDVYLPSVGSGFTFALTTFFDGLTFAGIPPYGSCADSVQPGECPDLKICVANGTTYVDRTYQLFSDEFVVIKRNIPAALQGLANGDCNAIGTAMKDLTNESIREFGGWEGEYEVGTHIYSNEPFTPLVRQDDPLFASLVYWVISATFYAEEQGITQAQSNKMPVLSLLGDNYFLMFRHVIEAVGNYGEIYERNLERFIPRSGANELNSAPYGPQLFVRPGLK